MIITTFHRSLLLSLVNGIRLDKGGKQVDKKPLIGVSLCAVVLLVLGSLSNVVGYQSVKSTVNDSPLFQTRTQRANNQQPNSITSKFLGKGNLYNIPISENRNEQVKKAIEFISKMDNKTFARFTKLCIYRIKADKASKDINPNDIIKTLTLLKIKTVSNIDSSTDRNKANIASSQYLSSCPWFPGCFLFQFILAIIVMFFLYFSGLTFRTCPYVTDCQF